MNICVGLGTFSRFLYVCTLKENSAAYLVRVVPVKQKILRFLRFLRALNRLAKVDLYEPRKILKSILRFLREVTRLGKHLRAPEQILRTHFAKFFTSKID